MDVILCFLNEERMSVFVSASLENGCLKVEGVDVGEAVTEFWGNDDYEYGLDLDEADTDKLFGLICRAGETPADALLRMFCGRDAFFAMKRFCTEHGIACKNWSRV